MPIRSPAEYLAAVQQAQATLDRILAMSPDFAAAVVAREQLTRLASHARANQPPPAGEAAGLTLSLLAVREFDDQHPALAHQLREIEAAAEVWAGITSPADAPR